MRKVLEVLVKGSMSLLDFRLRFDLYMQYKCVLDVKCIFKIPLCKL